MKLVGADWMTVEETKEKVSKTNGDFIPLPAPDPGLEEWLLFMKAF